MKSYQRLLAVLVMLILAVTTVRAQGADQAFPSSDQTADTGEQKKGIDWKSAFGFGEDPASQPGFKKPATGFFDLSGQLFFQWAYLTGYNNSAGNSWNRVYRWGVNADYYPVMTAVSPVNYSAKKNNTFSVQRAYITIRKQINDIFSAKVTIDVDPTAANYAFLKHAFIQAQYNFGPVAIRGEIGKVATPVIGITDDLSDLRWAGKNALDNAKFFLNGKSYDSPADLGILYGMTILKMINIQYTLTNGEGYRSDEIYKSKAHTVLLSVNPSIFIKEAYVNFYGRWEDLNRHEFQTTTAGALSLAYRGISNRSYMGFGVAWKSDLIKLGVNCFFPEQLVARKLYPFTINDIYQLPASRHTVNHILVDSWLNVDLGSLTPAGVLIIGRCMFGREMKSFQANLRRQHDTLLAAVGVGYKFNRNLRMLLMYDHTFYWIDSRLSFTYQKDPTPNRAVSIKAEVQF